MRRLVRYKPEESFADYRIFFVGTTVRKEANLPAENEKGKVRRKTPEEKR